MARGQMSMQAATEMVEEVSPGKRFVIYQTYMGEVCQAQEGSSPKPGEHGTYTAAQALRALILKDEEERLWVVKLLKRMGRGEHFQPTKRTVVFCVRGRPQKGEQ